MKQEVSEYIGQYLVSKGVTHNFTVPGGGAMYLNMAFGHTEGLANIFVQHEQTAAMAAEAFARVNNVPALVCCTTGPGGTNTLTGVLGAWLDSIPMIIISGQVKYPSTKMASGLNVRALGDQEYDIVPVASHMTKYAVTITDPLRIKEHLDRAWFEMVSGRPGPVWLDVPQDVQRAIIETDDLLGYDSSSDYERLPKPPSREVAEFIIEKIRSSERPVLNLGNAVRISGAYEDLQELIHRLNVPVVVGFNSIDTIPSTDDLCIGRAGIMGDRPGNWAVQNSDLFLSIGSRLSVRQVGYNVNNWARAAYTIVEDIDPEELKKKSIHVDCPLSCDAHDLVRALLEALGETVLPEKKEWVEVCRGWRHNYPVVREEQTRSSDIANVYHFMARLSEALPEGEIIVTGNGSAYVASSQALAIKPGQRYISNSGAASMGYDIPAAIGACMASGRRETICLSGDGSIQMNLQDLQTIVFHKLPIKIFVINNSGYHSMRQTESNLFPDMTHVGIGPETGDLSFPDMEAIAGAYGIPYVRADKNGEVDSAIEQTLACCGPALCEIFVATDQKFEPKSATKKLPDGTLVSPPLEDLAPFLPREELEKIMLIPLWEEK